MKLLEIEVYDVDSGCTSSTRICINPSLVESVREATIYGYHGITPTLVEITLASGAIFYTEAKYNEIVAKIDQALGV